MQNIDLERVLMRLPIEVLQSEAVQRALRVHQAVCSGNYTAFCKLFLNGGSATELALMEAALEKVGPEEVGWVILRGVAC